MEEIVFGIDPGKTGAIAIIDCRNHNAEVHDMPIDAEGRVDARELHTFFSSVKQIDFKVTCFIEKSQALPRQGVTSTFNYGVTYGITLACLQNAAIPFQEIRPQRWKKEFMLIKKDKKDSVAAAIKLFPYLGDQLKRKKKRGEKGFVYEDGRAEALLIAEYCRRICNG